MILRFESILNYHTKCGAMHEKSGLHQLDQDQTTTVLVLSDGKLQLQPLLHHKIASLAGVTLTKGDNVYYKLSTPQKQPLERGWKGGFPWDR